MISFEKVCFSYGKKEILSDVSYSLAKGEILAIMGESGCGKSTLLHLCAGLRKPKSGTVQSRAEKISYAFQEPRLLPWLTVAENIKAVLPKDPDADAKIRAALEIAELSASADAYPDELSGGMRTRASLARALAYGGDLCLLDEPFAALDEAMRRRIALTLREEFRKNHTSVILVTHQRSDAELLADRVIEM